MYDFMTLAPDDFEALVADLFSSAWGARLESFKPGKDGGVDLRHSRVPAGQPEVIVQCKRYGANRFTSLVRSMRDEAENLNALKPARYVLATSIPLSDHQKDQLVELLRPWCKDKSDIYGMSEINGLLRAHPGVLQAHFKLWVSSTAVLARVLHADVFALSDANIESARAMVSRLVLHPGFTQALTVLEQRRHVLILGNPGIGKSTLARMLMCHYLRDDFEPVWTTSMRDAWKVAHAAFDESRKVFIVLDDFLGRLRFAERKLERDEDRSFFALLDFASRHGNLRLVLTTREYILEDAKLASGLLDERANELGTFTLRLEEYSQAHRARMVFNHLYFSDLQDSRLKALVQSGTYRTIISHRHFNPRVVENISKAANSHSMSDAQYLDYICAEFNNPKDLWRHPFDNEIAPLAQRILFVLWTFNGTCELTQLQVAVSRLQTETLAEDRADEFNAALRQLDGNFLATTRYDSAGGEAAFVATFQNPSVEEFVEQRLIANPAMVYRIVDCVVSFNQVGYLKSLLDKQPALITAQPDLWRRLRDAAVRVQDIGAGGLVWSGQRADAKRIWWCDIDPPAVRIHKLLQIEKKAGTDHANSQRLRRSLSEHHCWLTMIKGSESTDSIARAANRLQRWIASESGWPEEEIAASAAAFRAAIITLLQGEDAWSISISSMVDLLDGCLDGSDDWLTDDEANLVEAAAHESVNTILNNVDDPNEVTSEARQLRTLGVIANATFHDEIERLGKFAKYLREHESDDAKQGEKLSYSDTSDVVLDVDQLFQDLLKR